MENNYPYGMHLPIFTSFYTTPTRPLTIERIEREAERLMDSADRAFMNESLDVTQDQYNAWCHALDAWQLDLIRTIWNSGELDLINSIGV